MKKKKETTKPVRKKEKLPIGRPLTLSPELVETIATALSAGLTRETAARMAGVSYQAFYNWRLRGEIETAKRSAGDAPNEREDIFVKLFKEIEAAETKAIGLWQKTVNTAAKTDPGWAMRMLYLRDPKGYGGQSAINWTANIDYTKLTHEQLTRLAAGEDPAVVLADSGDGGSGTPPAANNDQPASK